MSNVDTKSRFELGGVLVLVGNEYSYLQEVEVYFKTYGLFDVEIVNIQDFLNISLFKIWSITIIPGHLANTLGIDVLNNISKRSGCVYIEMIPEDFIFSITNDISPLQTSFPEYVSICNASLVARLNDLLSGYASVNNIAIDPISYSAVSGEEDVLCSIFSKEDSFGIILNESVPELTPELQDSNEKDVVYLLRHRNMLMATLPFLHMIIEGYLIPELSLKGYRFGGNRNREGLELALLHILANVAKDSGLPIFTIEPWPAGINHVLTLRQDYDRKVDAEDWQRILDWQQQNNLRASWYFLGTTADKEKIHDLIQRQHEIGFHYRDIKQYADKDTKVLKESMDKGADYLFGATCHGGNFSGVDDIKWLDKHNFIYTEGLGRCSLFPYTCIYEHENKLNKPLQRSNCVLTARHVSVDISVSPPKADLAFIKRTQHVREKLSAHTIIMNHPDINFSETIAAIEFCNSPGTEFWTQFEVVNWWKDSHYNISVKSEYDSENKLIIRDVTHDAQYQPVFRVWADVTRSDSQEDQKYGEIHSIFFENHIEYSLTSSFDFNL